MVHECHEVRLPNTRASGNSTNRTFLNGAIACRNVRLNPSVSMLPRTKVSMDTSNILSIVSWGSRQLNLPDYLRP